eukprot:4543449-Amphidinium_carterae.2
MFTCAKLWMLGSLKIFFCCRANETDVMVTGEPICLAGNIRYAVTMGVCVCVCVLVLPHAEEATSSSRWRPAAASDMMLSSRALEECEQAEVFVRTVEVVSASASQTHEF